MLNVKMCNGSHAAFDKAMLANFADTTNTKNISYRDRLYSARDSTF